MPIHRVYRTASPYNSSELQELGFEQTADVMYLAHTNHAPGKLTRADHDDWTFADVDFQPLIDAPGGISGSATTPNTDSANSGNAYFPQPAKYCVTGYNEDTGQESRASNTVTLTNELSLKRNYNTINWSAVSGATEYRIYKAENTQQFGFIGRTTSLTFRDDNIGPDLSQGPPIADNPFASSGDYPGTVTFFEQRSIWGRTTNRPNAIYFSRSADYENMDFTRPTQQNDAFVIGLVANKVNVVNSLVANRNGLLSLTSNNIFSVLGSNEDYLTAAPPPRIRPEIGRGASRLKPISIDTVVFYETAKTGEIRTIGYKFELDGIQTDDITIFSRHLFTNYDIVAWAYGEKPASAIVVIRDDGKAVCLTWDQSQQVWGWTLYETDGLFKDVCVVTEFSEDRFYFLVEREIGGVTKLYVERGASELWENQEDACFLDCARTFFNEAEVDFVDRLDHLEGREVVVWADGSKISQDGDGNPLVVTDGSLTLPVPALTITVGLPFTAEIETLPLAMQTGQGWSVARPQQAANVILRVVESRNIKAGVDRDQMFEVKMRKHEAYDTPIDLNTGDFEVQMAGAAGGSSETVCVVRSEDPTPMHIAAVLIEPKFGDM